jgi:hypothetical protein
MKSATHLKFTEKLSVIGIDASILDNQLHDYMRGIQLGTLRMSCKQFGVGIRVDGQHAILSAPRDRLQPIAERLHYCRVPFMIL